jgi:folate-dependent phosphoribosylglycinamide formyltransferase PurN
MLMLTRRRLKVGVLCSQRAPGLAQLLNTDPRRGTDYEIVCCLTSSDTFSDGVKVERRGIPCLQHSIRAFCGEHGTSLTDLDTRVDYDFATLSMLEPYAPDILLLDGYLLLLTDPMLSAYEGRIINVHHSDLALRNAIGGPRYPGLHAVRDALAAGESETRATAHIVTDRLDDGPVLLRSWSFPVPAVVGWARRRGASDILRACTWAHQEWMLREGWTPMLARAIELAGLALEELDTPLNLAAVGRWALEADGTLTPDGVLAGR